MIRRYCDGCEEELSLEPYFTVIPHVGVQTHFHGYACLAGWAAANNKIGWMGRPE